VTQWNPSLSRTFVVEIKHSHKHDGKNHIHHQFEKAVDHKDSANKSSQKSPEDSHCHKICVSACSPILVSGHDFSFLALESREIFAADLDTYFPSAKLGSIFRPPIFA
jgi:hypothetical protein